MEYNTFVSLCTILEPHVVKVDTNFRKFVRIDKAMAMILCKLAFGHDDRAIGQKFAQGRFTIQRYNLIICRILVDKNLLFSKYISTPIGQRVHNGLERFHGLSRLPKMRGVQLMVVVSSCGRNQLNVV